MASNMVMLYKKIYSDKFQLIKNFIEDHPNELHMVFSNFVENGCLAFQYFCQ